MDIEEIISENVKKLINDRKDFTAYQLAKAIGIDPNDLNSRIRNDTHWRADHLIKIASYFGVTIESLMGKENVMS